MSKEDLISELKRRKKSNLIYCDINDCEPSDYMLGQNDIIEDIIEYIKKLKL